LHRGTVNARHLYPSIARFHQGYWSDRKEYFPQDLAEPQPAADQGRLASGTTTPTVSAHLPPAAIELWRRWMINVFQPMNVKMEDALVNNAQLLVGDQMPPVFLQFISHTESYKAVIAKWTEATENDPDSGASLANVSPVAFPPRPNFKTCIIAQFHMLKALQQRLQEQLVGWLQPLKEQIPAECGLSNK
jgi:hypothetical protein